uniref:Uncharacterized protein n=1 Tax=Spumella elongata TaxID=89044 RepID=A0A7S3HID3_9STRA
MEKRVLAKVEAALAELGGQVKDLERKVDCGLAPLVHSVAQEMLVWQASGPPALLSQPTSVDAAAMMARVDLLEGRLAGLARETAALASSPLRRGAAVPACKLDTTGEQDNISPASNPIFRRLLKSGKGFDTSPSWSEKGMELLPGLGGSGGNALRMRGGATSKLGAGGAERSEQTAVPFARSIAPRQLDRSLYSRSMPHLPPVY